MRKKLLTLFSIILVVATFLPIAIFHAQGDYIDPVMAAIVDAAMGNLSQKLGKPQSRDITAWHIAGDAFNDASLDCPAPGQSYEQKVVRGYRIRITAPSQTDPAKKFDYQYRSTLDGAQLFECTPQGPGPNIIVILPTPIPEASAVPIETDGPPLPTVTPIQPPQAKTDILESTLLLNDPIPLEVRWTADGSQIVGIMFPVSDNKVQIIDLQSKTILLSFTPDKPRSSARFSPDGKTVALATSDGHITLFEATHGEKITELPGSFKSAPDLAWSPSGNKLAEFSAESLTVWDVKSGKADFSQQSTGGLLRWSPDDKLLVTNYGAGATQSPIVLDATNGKQKFTLDAVAADVKNVMWGPNGRSIALTGKDETIAIFNGTTGARLRNINGHAIQWSPDGTKLASATNHHATNIYDTGKGTVTLALNGGSTIENVVAFSPDGNRLATGDDDGSLRIWDVATGAVIARLDAHQDVYILQWKADGSQLLSFGFDNVIRLWNVPQS